MKFKSALVTAASGSLHGITASHNRGGQYLRSRVIPTNPATAFQQAVRNLMATLTAAWANVLTDSQRTGWNDYADAVTVKDTLGETRKLTGLDWYVACNVPRLQIGTLTRVDAAPATQTLADLTPPTITSITASTGVLVMAFTNTDTWATAVGGALAVYISRPVSPGVSFFKGPFRFLGKVLGAAMAPASPFTSSASPFPYTAGQKVFVQVRALNADGRISSPFRASKIAV